MYRIYTEDLNRPAIEALLSEHFDGYTLIPAEGAWHGVKEHSLVIELFTEDGRAVDEVAQEIRDTNKQESVAVVSIPDSIHFANQALAQVAA